MTTYDDDTKIGDDLPREPQGPQSDAAILELTVRERFSKVGALEADGQSVGAFGSDWFWPNPEKDRSVGDVLAMANKIERLRRRWIAEKA